MLHHLLVLHQIHCLLLILHLLINLLIRRWLLLLLRHIITNRIFIVLLFFITRRRPISLHNLLNNLLNQIHNINWLVLANGLQHRQNTVLKYLALLISAVLLVPHDDDSGLHALLHLDVLVHFHVEAFLFAGVFVEVAQQAGH